MFALITAVLLFFAPTVADAQSQQTFTPVQGTNLQAKQEAAIAQAAGSRQARFWTAYSFDVRPGVAVDVDFVSDDGHFRMQGSWELGDSSYYFMTDSVINYPGLETRSLGVFALRDSSGAVERVEV